MKVVRVLQLICFWSICSLVSPVETQVRRHLGSPRQPQAPPPVAFLGWDYASLGYTLNPGEKNAPFVSQQLIDAVADARSMGSDHLSGDVSIEPTMSMSGG